MVSKIAPKLVVLHFEKDSRQTITHKFKTRIRTDVTRISQRLMEIGKVNTAER